MIDRKHAQKPIALISPHRGELAKSDIDSTITLVPVLIYRQRTTETANSAVRVRYYVVQKSTHQLTKLTRPIIGIRSYGSDHTT